MSAHGVSVSTTDIPGLLLVRLPVHRDRRGWFKESWQREAMVAAGLPDFGPVQHNVSFNADVGVTRGMHAEPWDKLVSVAAGRVFGAWVDLREGAGFGTLVTAEVDEGTAVFVPRGVANGYQTLEPATAYSYLVNDHWSADARDRYTFVDLADPELAIAWPVDLATATLSDADRAHPRLAEVTPVPHGRVLVLGAQGQLGRAFARELDGAQGLGREELDLTDRASVRDFDWSAYDVVVNAAAWTDVDGAETPEGRRAAWAANVTGVGELVRAARRHGFLLVHVSSDYVYDGTSEAADEDEDLAPLNAYGTTKAAGDVLVTQLERHLVLRTSWLVGEGRNFVRTMADLAAAGAEPAVVDDQVGRVTAASDLARAARHLIGSGAPSGVYHVTCRGPAYSWAELAARVFELCGRSGDDVRRVSTAERAQQVPGQAARPARSVLDLAKLEATGFTTMTTEECLAAYLS